jgi:hypothetical protein
MKALLLAAAVLAAQTPCQNGQCVPTGYGWLDASVEGRVVRVWGWVEGGAIRYWPAQNPHLGAAPAPAPSPAAPSPVPPMAGVTTDADGSLNSGVQIQGLKAHGGRLDTNDPAFGADLFREEESAGDRCPKRDHEPPWNPDAPALTDLKDYAGPAAILAVAAAIVLLGITLRRRG